MKKTMLAIVMVFCFLCVAYAQDAVQPVPATTGIAPVSEDTIVVTKETKPTIDITNLVAKLPALKTGIAYSIKADQWNSISTVEVIKWKGVALEAGYATGDTGVAVLSYKLLELRKWVDVPVLDLVECNLGAYVGLSDITGADRIDYGVSATLVNIKF